MSQPLAAGDRIGPYEILSEAGAGGMGVVYKAKDTRLNRFVAIKVLPPGKDANDGRRARFLQEAQAASALNHPNIVTIYDVGSHDGADYIAMEFVAGKTLDASIRREGMNVAELLRYAVQITDALSKAHAAGIIHRDLKPGNVMVSVEGQVKILDFGLAKLSDAPLGGESDETMSVRPKTAEGVVMGTAAYMSPEQAEGKPVDGRSDIFAIGAILYEMATGRRAFRGDTPVSTISAVLRDDPTPTTELRPELPAELGRVIARCLRKDPARRFQNVADLKVALEELKEESDSMRPSTTASGAVAAAQRPQVSRVWLGVAVAVALVAIVFAAWKQWGADSKPEAGLSVAPLTAFAGVEDWPALSPDGNQVAFGWTGEKDDNMDIYVKLIGPDPALRLTTSPDADLSPAWSPDGRSIAFVRRNTAEQKVEALLVPALGGAERKLGRVALTPFDRYLEWTPDGKWLFLSQKLEDRPGVSLVMLAPQTGEVKPLTRPAKPETTHGAAALSPDGKLLAYVETDFGAVGAARIWLQPLGEGYVPEGERRPVGAMDLSVRGVTWLKEGKELLYWGGSTSSRSSLFRVAVEGEAKPVAVNLPGRFQASATYSEKNNRLVYSDFVTSGNLWRLDLQNPAKAPEKFIFSTMRESFPQYSPDGKKIAFYSSRTGTQQVMVSDAEGRGQTQLTSAKALNNATPRWSPDGQWITFDSNVEGYFQIYRMSAEGGPARNITNDKNPSITASTSRDGKWIYYASQRNGRFDVWKIPSAGGAAQQVTSDGGSAPLESTDGQTLFYIKDGSGGLWKRPVAGGPETQVVPKVFRYNYAPTDKGIYYMKGTLGQRSATIEFLDFKSGATKVIAEMGQPDLGLDVSPDGRYLLYAQRERMASDLMLVENFR